MVVEALDAAFAAEPAVAHAAPGRGRVEAVVVVSAPPGLQRERVLKRPGMTPERFDQILALQLSDAEKRARADYVIDTSGPLEQTRAEVARLVEKLRG